MSKYTITNRNNDNGKFSSRSNDYDLKFKGGLHAWLVFTYKHAFDFSVIYIISGLDNIPLS